MRVWRRGAQGWARASLRTCLPSPCEADPLPTRELASAGNIVTMPLPGSDDLMRELVPFGATDSFLLTCIAHARAPHMSATTPQMAGGRRDTRGSLRCGVRKVGVADAAWLAAASRPYSS